MTYKRIPLGIKGMVIHIDSTSNNDSRYNMVHRPSFWWWFSNTLTLLAIVGAGLVIFVVGR